jgi:hypothetical protein
MQFYEIKGIPLSPFLPFLMEDGGDECSQRRSPQKHPNRLAEQSIGEGYIVARMQFYEIKGILPFSLF